MKKYLIIILLSISFIPIYAQSLGIIESKNPSEIHNLFNQEDITIHFYSDNYAIISGDYKGILPYSILEENGFNNNYKYFIHSINKDESQKLEGAISEIGDLLYNNQNFSIIRINEKSTSQFKPIKNDATVYFDDSKAFLKDKYKAKINSKVSYNDDTYTMLAKVNADSIEATIAHLSSYTTRNCYSTEVVEALNWIKTKFESYGLQVSLQSLSSLGIPSFNVIATQTGTAGAIEEEGEVGDVDPIEYVVIGGHADSYSSGATAPGADDNASGVAGVLEIARILSQNTYERTIIYCAFSGEEYGLYGSNYFATDFQNNEKNIIGYINLDMIGYKHSSQSVHTSLIYPTSAKELADFYRAICAIYLPNFGIIDGVLLGGNSDHASFNNNGYMGIFPFEDINNYSPYIHTSSDILGVSVNSMELAETLTKAALATTASLANTGYQVSIDDNINSSDYFNIYPNPATSNLYISFNGQQTIDVEVYNILGELVIKKTLDSEDRIDVSKLLPGTYFVKLNSENNSSVKKCIINGN